MKKLILLFLLIIVRVSIFAQENHYLPFAEEGKVWNMQYHNDLNHLQYPDYNYQYFIKGDTLISESNCKKLYVFNENNDGLTEYKMAIYETEGKVYFIPSGSTESLLLYDFQIQEGTSIIVADPIHPEWEIKMQNRRNGVTDANGTSRHCLFVNRVSELANSPSGWWIEGIGSELGPLNTWGFEAAGNYRFFLNCKLNGEIVFNMTDFRRTGKEDFYPEGTKWTEIRLDTLKYDSWYSKVGNEWVPNFETLEYYVKGEYLERYDNVPLKCVYTNGPTWTDSLSLLVRERMYDNMVEVNVPLFYEDNWGRLLTVPSSPEIYQFDWSVGKGLYYRDLMDFNSTGEYPYFFFFGVINEIKEGDFGGVRPLKYVDLDGKAPYDPHEPGNTDTKGGRIIQGIGVTEWNDGECLFGPSNPNLVKTASYGERHYRSMLVHFERNGEVLYDVWPKKPHQPQSFLEGNPIWVYKYEHIPQGLIWRDGHWVPDCWVDISDRHFTYYFLGNQKEIDGKVYTMMGAVISKGEDDFTVNHWLPVREENGIVYAFTDSLPGIIETEDNYDSRYNDEYNPMPYLQQGNECVLYNFSTNIGETLYPQNEGSTVKSFDTYQLLDGTECRVLKTNWGRYDLYEKLGFLSDDFDGIMDPFLSWPLPIDGSVHSSRLNAYYQDNVMLYKAPDAQGGLCVNDTITTLDDAYEYARSYKADPRQEEVFAYIRQLQKEKEPVTFTAGQIATIILPTEPDASKGKYYRLDRYEDGQIIFEQELQPQAHIPYIIVPNEDFSIDLSALDLAGCYRDTVSVDGISFIGSYVSETFDYPDGFYIDFIDITHDCRFEESCVIGALRAYLLVRWDDPYNQGGTRVPPLNKRGIVLRDYETGITSPLGETGEATLYDLQGRMLPSKPAQGIYIKNRQKVMVK